MTVPDGPYRRLSQIPAEVWLDADGLARRIAVMTDPTGGTGGTPMWSVVELWDFGVLADITPPAPGEVDSRLSGGSGSCGRGDWTADLSQVGQVFEGGVHAGEEPVERGLHAGIGCVIADTAGGVQPGPVQPARDVWG